jgi:hypothetical protein
MALVDDSGQSKGFDARCRSPWSCTFENMYGETYDIGDVVGQISIYESIYNNCMFGGILINDGNGFSERHNVIGAGNEKIYVKILTTGGADINSNIEKTFRVNSYSDASYSNKGNGVVSSELGFIYPYLILNNNTRISRSFNAMTASEIVDYITYDILKLGQSFEIDWDDLQTNEETKNVKNIVVPGWNPFKTINWLAEHSISASSGASNYLFYENNDGFHYNSIDLLKKKEPVRIFTFGTDIAQTVQSSKGGIEVRTDLMSGLENQFRFNHTQSQMNGLYGGKLFTHNILTKSYNNYEVEYNGDDEAEMAFYGLDGAGQFVSDTQASLGFLPDEYLYQIHDKKDKSHYIHRDMKMSEMRTNIVKFDIAGDTNVWAGNTIDINVPTNVRNNPHTTFDENLSGKWLVTAIHHKINNDAYVMTIECMKDGFEQGPEDGFSEGPGV